MKKTYFIATLCCFAILNLALAPLCLWLHSATDTTPFLFYLHWLFGPAAFFIWGSDAWHLFAIFTALVWIPIALSIATPIRDLKIILWIASASFWLISPLFSFLLSV